MIQKDERDEARGRAWVQVVMGGPMHPRSMLHQLRIAKVYGNLLGENKGPLVYCDVCGSYAWRRAVTFDQRGPLDLANANRVEQSKRIMRGLSPSVDKTRWSVVQQRALTERESGYVCEMIIRMRARHEPRGPQEDFDQQWARLFARDRRWESGRSMSRLLSAYGKRGGRVRGYDLEGMADYQPIKLRRSLAKEGTAAARSLSPDNPRNHGESGCLAYLLGVEEEDLYDMAAKR